jgi:hypothetical protein
VFKGTPHAGSKITLDITVTRFDGTGTDTNDGITATGTLTVTDASDNPLFTATLTGESSTLDTALLISGFYDQSGALGGFHLTITQNTGTDPLSDFAFEGNAA